MKKRPEFIIIPPGPNAPKDPSVADLLKKLNDFNPTSLGTQVVGNGQDLTNIE